MEPNKFCLLAIRPLLDCNPNFRRNLKDDIIYPFYGGHRFLNGEEDVKDSGKDITSIKIDDNIKIPKSLYQFNDRKFKFEISVSAIVGQNGAGKSTLLELFYASCYYITYYKSLNDTAIIPPSSSLKREFFADLKVEIYFIESGQYRRIVIRDSKVKCEELYSDSWIPVNLDGLPFYSIAANYSLYGLNSSEPTDKWLNALFHKNDGYQTPLVINPFRQDGNINVNSEFHLAQGRLITNLGLNIHAHYRLNGDLYAKQIVFGIALDKLYHFDEETSLIAIISTFEEENKIDILEFVNDLMKTLIGYVLPDELRKDIRGLLEAEIRNLQDSTESQLSNEDESLLRMYLLIKYVIRKVYRICLNYYKEYGEIFVDFDYKHIPYFILKEQGTFFEKLATDNSHTTVKLKQALYAIKNKFHEKLTWMMTIGSEADNDTQNVFLSNPITVQEFGNIVHDFKLNNKGVTEEFLVPAAFFIPNIKVGKSGNENVWDFKKMSSGEQQIIQSIQSILYHILNINSVHKANDIKRKKYKYVNIILDEIELYYHPQYQKTFIYEFMQSLKEIADRLDYIDGLNLLFSTHSPFILSDLANWNVLKLEKGFPSISNHKTFAANIHNLLENDFFLKNGYIGEWAKYKLEAFTHENYNATETDLEIVDLIGEPMLRNSLMELLMQNKPNSEIDALIQKLENLKK